MESQHSRGQFELPDDSDRHNNLFLFVPKDNCLRKSYLGRSTMFEAPTDGKGAKRSNVSHLDESQAMSSWARHTIADDTQNRVTIYFVIPILSK